MVFDHSAECDCEADRAMPVILTTAVDRIVFRAAEGRPRRGDSAGVKTLRRSLADWLTDMNLISAGSMAENDGYIGCINGGSGEGGGHQRAVKTASDFTRPSYDVS
jgi:hypothetical protein